MDNYEDYRIRLRQAADYAFNYGLKKISQDRHHINSSSFFDKATFQEFAIACHDGFKLSQKLIIDEIIKYQNELREEIVKLKEFRRMRDEANIKKNENLVKIITQRIQNFSHIADGIAWQMLGGQIHIARRIHLQLNNSKFLDSSNVNSAIKTADKINEDPKCFALLSDLTNYIQIGDLIVRDGNKLSVIELKEGVVNDALKEFFKSKEIPIHEIPEEELKNNFDKKTVDQAKRMQRQHLRGKQAEEVINTDKGIDPATGSKITVRTPEIRTEYFHNELHKLYQNLQSKIWAYDLVEGCLHLGMYCREGIWMARTIEGILKHNTTNYLIIDWLSITENVSEPLFSKPFPLEFVIDILTGKVKVVLGLDLDKLIECFNFFGLSTRWMTEKETAKVKQLTNANSIVIVNKRAICMRIENQEIFLSGGILSKLFYDCILPSNIAITILNSFPAINVENIHNHE